MRVFHAVPGLQHEHRLTYDREALPALPLRLAWLPPLRAEETLTIQRNRTLPIKFSLRDAQGNFVVDESVTVWVVDASSPGSALAAFTTQGSNRGRSDAVRIDPQEGMYTVNLRLRDYPFQVGRTYLVGATVFGQSFETTAFMVVR